MADAILRAAGALLIHDGRVLLLQRAPGSDHPGEWCCPGGGIEAGESPAEAAVREIMEETGETLDGPGRMLCHRISEGVDYTTFTRNLPAAFSPVLNEEHVAAGWFPLSDLPLPLHPGVKISLACLAAHELDLARMMMAGQITSPVRYRNVWLFDLRITGTGAAYRTTGEEYVWRDRTLYLNDDFLERCQGLQVIWEHPPKMLDSEEFANRSVGAIFLPYIKGDEVWGIAKIYDDAAAALMIDDQKSTSPGLVLSKATNQTGSIADGTKFLIEGEAILLDHLAICDRGVWDKTRAASGVNIEGATSVADEADDKTEDGKADATVKMDAEGSEAKKGEDAKADAAAEDAKKDSEGGNIDKVLAKLDAMSTRMDAQDAKLDAACAKMDSSKKDATDAEEDKAEGKAVELAADKKDAAKMDAADDKEMEELKSDNAKLRGDVGKLSERLDQISAAQPKAPTEKDFGDTAEVQHRYDSLYSAMGKGDAPGPRRGETSLAYRRRLASQVKDASKPWAAVDLYALDSTAFDVAEAQVFDSAMAVAERPVVTEPGRLVERTRVDRQTGLRTTTFHGPNTFIAGMKRAPRRALISARRARES